MNTEPRLDWNRIADVLALVAMLSMFVERALAPLFESRFFLNRAEPLMQPARTVKEPIAFLLSLAVCLVWRFDAVSVLFQTTGAQLFGEVLTAGVVAGGTKASVKLFREVLGLKSRAFAEREAVQKVQMQATLADAHREAAGVSATAVPAPLISTLAATLPADLLAK